MGEILGSEPRPRIHHLVREKDRSTWRAPFSGRKQGARTKGVSDGSGFSRLL
jgi:hypothetical protein